MKLEYKLDSGTSKNGKEYYCIKLVIDNKVEKVLLFITKDQYTLLTSK